MNRKEKEKSVRKIFKQGKTSLAVTLPVDLIAQLRWREGQKVKALRHRGGILIKDWKK